MLLILLAIHLLSRDSIAAPLSHPPDARATTDSCGRTLFSIVWGCLATIFACTWVSVHPNVPPPNQNWLQLFWRRLKMVLITMIAPEVMVGFAARQYFGSRELANSGPAINDILNLTSLHVCVEFNFSTTHGMFFSMGGFVSSAGHPITTIKQLEDPDLGPKFQKAIRNVNEEDIKDRSKGDAFSKGVALLQGLWFILQTLARAHQRLAVTQLEIATLAFAVVNIFIWLLWWNKPLDVQRPIVIGPPTQPDTETITLPVSLLERILLHSAILGLSEDYYQPLSSVSVPLFWSIENQSKHGAGAFILLDLVGIVFGAIHCAAWSAVFPTRPEMWIWRMSAVVITAMPGLTLLSFLIAMNEWLEPVVYAGGGIVLLGIPFYIAARIILIVLPLMELRSLPASAFVDVNWSSYIPHI
ncbi:hypothetical protein MSAN_00624900 [Mycena sanguinolenta]|uniref:Uncharacterized protein n=1 Tax=Mycena sanguinolenta TaxID=230812 RepID=A0A8H6Z4Y3_9AGAR|nr:hypothetical protein MSAN_00624900 [Mycena sanguinolenta]